MAKHVCGFVGGGKLIEFVNFAIKDKILTQNRRTDEVHQKVTKSE